MVGFVIQSTFLGVGLAMDATCVAMTNGLNYPKLRIRQALLIAFMFGFFQALMPLIGYLLGVNFSNFLSNFIPFIALGILSVLGVKMLLEGLKKCEDEEEEVYGEDYGSEFYDLLWDMSISTNVVSDYTESIIYGSVDLRGWTVNVSTDIIQGTINDIFLVKVILSKYDEKIEKIYRIE